MRRFESEPQAVISFPTDELGRGSDPSKTNLRESFVLNPKRS